MKKIVSLLCLSAFLVACGQKGALYLPTKSTNQKIAPQTTPTDPKDNQNY